MLYVLYCLDRPDSTDLRLANREAHLAYVRASGAQVRMGGPLLASDGETMIGSLIVLDVEDLDAAEAWSAADPYRKAGLFERVSIHPFRWLIDNRVD